MKVSDTYGAQGVQVSTFKETAPAKEAQQKRRQAQEGVPSSGGDKVDLSSTSKDVAKAGQAVAAASDVRSERVAELRSQVENGTYKVDARQVADRMLRDIVTELV